MLKKIELNNQNTFFKYDENTWYDGYFEYEVKFYQKLCILSSFYEVYGDTEYIKTLNDINDLKDTYELLTNKIFE